MAKKCLNCDRSDQDIPLVSLQYRGEAKFICSQCFPNFIHAPAKLAGKLDGAEQIPPAEHEH